MIFLGVLSCKIIYPSFIANPYYLSIQIKWDLLVKLFSVWIYFLKPSIIEAFYSLMGASRYFYKLNCFLIICVFCLEIYIEMVKKGN
jgi:hypothetical protein